MATKNIFINREISWLHFNGRVLQEAIDQNTPLIERIKFLGIYSNNRDEFFRVRVGTLRRMLNLDSLNYKVKYDPHEILKQIKAIVEQQEEIFNSAYKEIREELANEKILLVDDKKLSKQDGEFVRRFFNEEVRQHLFPIMLDNVSMKTTLEDSQLYLLVDLRSKDGSLENNQAVVEVPSKKIDRFVIIPGSDEVIKIILLDDVIRYCLDDIFSIFGYNKFNTYTIKFTRDAELDIDNDVSKSFLELLSESIKQRKKGVPVRFVYERSIPANLLKKLTKRLKITEQDNLRSGGRYHNFKDFMSFPRVGPSHLVYPSMPPLPHKDFHVHKSIFEVIREKDVMLHYPYQSYHYVVDFLREASIDPKVTSIKMTFYRTSKDSGAMNALINAARNRKKVSVFMEIQARFDEEANIFWTNKLQEEGVEIIQTIPGFKVHSKLMLIKRMEGDEELGYANISTGNFHEATAKVYADDSLLTADQKITSEVDKVFQLFQTRYKPPTFNHLIVSPFHTRNFFINLLENEIKNKKEGKNAWAIIKLNSLVDKKIVRKLYQASQAGVRLQIIVRGICVLIPGIKGRSENIEAFSIVDKYLEHSRVYVFCNDDNNRYFISSADWMQRNFDHRIEVSCPIYDKDIQDELMTILKIQLCDNTKARYISAENPNQYRITHANPKVRAQFKVYDFFKERYQS